MCSWPSPVARAMPGIKAITISARRSARAADWKAPRNEIGDEENAGTQAERGLRQAEVLVHRKRGKTDVHPIQVGNEVAGDEERNEAFRDLGDGSV